jgi:hypothetical protein
LLLLWKNLVQEKLSKIKLYLSKKISIGGGSPGDPNPKKPKWKKIFKYFTIKNFFTGLIVLIIMSFLRYIGLTDIIVYIFSDIIHGDYIDVFIYLVYGLIVLPVRFITKGAIDIFEETLNNNTMTITMSEDNSIKKNFSEEIKVKDLTNSEFRYNPNYNTKFRTGIGATHSVVDYEDVLTQTQVEETKIEASRRIHQLRDAKKDPTLSLSAQERRQMHLTEILLNLHRRLLIQTNAKLAYANHVYDHINNIHSDIQDAEIMSREQEEKFVKLFLKPTSDRVKFLENRLTKVEQNIKAIIGDKATSGDKGKSKD